MKGIQMEENKEKEIQELQKQMDEHYEKAWELRDKIEELKLSEKNYKKKCVVRSSGYGAPFNDYMIVNDQQLYEDKHKKRVSLTGLTFYMNDNTCYSDSAEVFFSGWHTWWFDYDEFLDLEKSQKIKVIDRETFTNEIKGYTKSLEIFINDWIERYFRSIDNEEE